MIRNFPVQVCFSTKYSTKVQNNYTLNAENSFPHGGDLTSVSKKSKLFLQITMGKN